MTTHEDGESSRNNSTQLACVMGWLAGVGLLGLALIPTQAWTNWFLHPLITLDGIPRQELITGVALLRIMLPISGLGWIAWTLMHFKWQNEGSLISSGKYKGQLGGGIACATICALSVYTFFM